MDKLLTSLISSIISNADSSINSVFNGLIELVFRCENFLNSNLGVKLIDYSSLKAIILNISLSLIVIKFLKKGFDMYVMWTDGESDTSPLSYIVYFIRAVVVALCFTILYDWVIDVAISFGNDMLKAMGMVENSNLTTQIASIASTGIFNGIISLIALILIFALYVQFLIRSLEMFVLKLGFPLACVGLINPDGGVFKSYIEKLFKSVLTVLIQIILCKIGIVLVLNLKLFFGIAAFMLALKTPRFIQEFMLTSSVGGVSNIIMTTSKTMELSSQIKRRISRLRN